MEKELAYGTAIAITAERALRHYQEIVSEKEERRHFFALFLSITADEFKKGSFKRGENGEEQTYAVTDVGNNALMSISGCDEELRLEFQDIIAKYRRAIVKQHESDELENIRLCLQDSFEKCMGNDGKIDVDNLRQNLNIFFKFMDLFNVKENLDVTQNVDEAVKQIQERMKAPSLRRQTGGSE